MTVDLSPGAETNQPVVIKAGAKYRRKLRFRVTDGTVMGLTSVLATYRGNLRVNQDKTLLGSFATQTEPHEVSLPRHGWEEAPTDQLAMRSYTVKDTLKDDDGRQLSYEYSYEIKTDW